MDTDNEPVMTPGAIFITTIFSTIMLGVVDWASGYELQFFVFYFVPIVLAGWMCGSREANGVAILSAVTWFVADYQSSHPYSHLSIAVWNTTIRLVAFLVLGQIVARLRFLLQKQRKISEELQKTLSEVRTLSGLLPICADCKKIRNDNGYWQQLEEYLSNYTNAKFTHGLCQDCMRKTLKTAGLSDEDTENTIKKETLTRPHPAQK
jgi:hypothetical protein